MSQRLGFIALASVALAMGWVSFGYVTGPTSEFAEEFQAKYIRHLALVLFHGLLGITALVAGPLQFMPGLRRQWPRVHRIIGMIYLTTVFLGSISGLRMALMAEGGVPAQLGFSTLALAWFATAALALRAARQGRYGEHRDWMIRNYALTFSAVTLRLGLYGLQAAGLSWYVAYPMMAYGSWLPNLLVAELLFISWPRFQGGGIFAKSRSITG